MIRLAAHKGVFASPSLNFVQEWALRYWLNLERRTTVEDKIEEIKVLTYHLDPLRYQAMYGDDFVHQVTMDGQSIEGKPIDDADLLDQWFDTLSQQKGLTGAQVEGVYQETRRRV